MTRDDRHKRKETEVADVQLAANTRHRRHHSPQARGQLLLAIHSPNVYKHWLTMLSFT